MNKTKKIIALVAMTLAMATVSNGQIFETEDGVSNRYGIEDPTGNGIIPLNGGTIDQTNEIYTPIGSGVFLFTMLAGAYWLNNKKKRESGK